MSVERFLLVSDRGCPFAHRVRALFAHLGVEHDHVESAPGTHPPELARWSPSHRLPILVQRGVGIGESRVMLEWVAEAYAFADAYPADPLDRALHREAMAIIDEKIAPTLLREQPLRPARLAELLDRLTYVAERTPPTTCMLTLHAAPIWQRLQWWRGQGPITKAILARAPLAAWLDAAAALPAVVATSPSKAENIEDFNTVCALGASA